MPEIMIKSRYLSDLTVGELRAKPNAARTQVLRYYIDLAHIGLKLHRELSAPDINVLQNKVDTLLASWDQKFDAFQALQAKAAGKSTADEMAADAEERREKLRSVLLQTLAVNDEVDWEVLKDKQAYQSVPFSIRRPTRPRDEPEPAKPRPNILQKLTGAAKRLDGQYRSEINLHRIRKAESAERFEREIKDWEEKERVWREKQDVARQEFEAIRDKKNEGVESLRQRWIEGDPEAIVEHASMVLDTSDYHELIEKSFDLQFQSDSKTLLVEYRLPAPDDLPLAKTVRFIPGTGELKVTQISAAEKKSLYDEICYQICLRTIHELFEADTPGHIQNVVFNGNTRALDKATGNHVESVILSILVDRSTFETLNLRNIDPKACFKSLKGVSASSLVGLAPVPPVMQLDKADRRFIDAKDVALPDDGATNLASMDWEEFEHLVRKLFEMEFASRGGEVKVTQASSDGGVDAVAFDPDPISGGKIVIQAKRYTNTVGVAAVRDLYGTTLSEGASKGILVTTSEYGPDAYKFATGKPLTLLTGSNLLHLLKKHGMNAKIDIHEARRELGLATRNGNSPTA